MADDIDLWAMGNDGMLTSLTGAYRLGAATGAGAGDAFPASLLVYKQANGYFTCGDRLGIGVTSPAAMLDVSGSIIAGEGNATTGGAVLGSRYNDGQVATFGNLRGSAITAIGFCVRPSSTTSGGWVSSVSGAWARSGVQLAGSLFSVAFAASQTTAINDPVALTNAFIVNAGGAVTPGVDNSQSLGTSSLRWSVVYAGTGTINTSDIRFKLFRVGPSMAAAEQAAALEIADAFAFYRFTDAIAAKGEDDARWHFGVGAQVAWGIWASHGLVEPLGEDGKPPAGCIPPAFLCFDEWGEESEEREVYSETLVDGDGNPLQIGTESVVTREAGYLFALRMDELHSLLIAALNKERKDQAARIAALEAAA
jgi:hypothetical protein